MSSEVPEQLAQNNPRQNPKNNPGINRKGLP